MCLKDSISTKLLPLLFIILLFSFFRVPAHGDIVNNPAPAGSPVVVVTGDTRRDTPETWKQWFDRHVVSGLSYLLVLGGGVAIGRSSVHN